MDICKAESYVLTSHASCKKNKKAGDLSRDCCNSGASYAKSKYKNKKRVKSHVHNCSAHKTYHGIHGTPLESELVVDNKLTYHEGRTKQNDPHVILSILEGCLAGTYHI